MTFGQKVIGATETKKVNTDGIEVAIFRGKPFTGIIKDNYPNGKPNS